MPALATARLSREQQKLPAAAARRQPQPVKLFRREMPEPLRHLGQSSVASSRAIRQIDRIEALEPDQQGVHPLTPHQPFVQPRSSCVASGEASQGIAARRRIGSWDKFHCRCFSTDDPTKVFVTRGQLPSGLRIPYDRVMPKQHRLALLVSETPRAQEAAAMLRAEHEFVPLDEAEVAVVIGGDGQMLHVLHQMLDAGRVIPAYGMNLGTIGFLMNRPKSSRALTERVARAKPLAVTPLQMTATTGSGEQHTFSAINEVSLLRETRQTARLEISVNAKVRIPELFCDGILVATPAGSTAYNLSANGPILPLGSNMLALTPISPFRPRRWRGAIIPDHYEIEFRVLEADKRPVAAVADQQELRDIQVVKVRVAREQQLTLLFDPGKTLEERIFAEQFQF